MKLVIQTQYKENYGAHDWDGKGECPQYWKFKGGDTYVVRNVNNTDLLPQLEALITYSCLLYTSPSPRDRTRSRMPSSA